MRPPRSVAVVGGGVIGLCTAYYLALAGIRVTVLERRHVGAGASEGNAGWICPSFSAPLPGPGMTAEALASLWHPEGPLFVGARSLPSLAPWLWRFWRSCSSKDHLAGMRATARLARPTMELFDAMKADGVEFVETARDLVYACTSERKAEALLAALQPMGEFGYELPAHPSGGDKLRAVEPALSESIEAGFFVPGERAIVPSTLVRGLAGRAQELGVRIVEGSEVISIEGSDSSPPVIRTMTGPVVADAVVLAAGAWTSSLARSFGLRVPMQAGKGYSLSVRTAVMPSHPLYFGEARVAATPMGDRLRLTGGMEFSGLNAKMKPGPIKAILRSASPYLKAWTAGSDADHWTGMRPVAPDGLPILGAVPGFDRIYLATGHAMLGITLAPATGQCLAELITTGRASRILDPFRIERFGRIPAKR